MAKMPAPAEPASLWTVIDRANGEVTSAMETQEGVVLRVDAASGMSMLFVPGVMIHRDGSKLARKV